MSYSPRSEERPSNISANQYGIPTSSSRDSTSTSAPNQASVGLQRDGFPRSAPALPSLATLTNEVENTREQGGSGSPTPWRSVGVRNILNPAPEAQAVRFQPLPPSPQTRNIAGQRGSQAPLNTSPHVRKRGEPPSPACEPQTQQGGRTSRKILTPRSPGLRAASLGAHRSPSVGAGLIHRIPLPPGEGRVYTAEPGESHDSAVPPLPPLSAAARGGLPGIQSRDAVSPATHTTASNAPFPPINAATQRQDNRTEPTRPSYTGGEASSLGLPQMQSQMLQPPANAGNEHQTSYMPPAPGPVRSGIPYGQTEYQLTFETQQGPMVVPVNVDFQQASRLADEKRKRNAGASARFRARRKEKEREANQTITGLQQELQDLMDEREFYRVERNFFREMLARSNPGPLPSRPHSPQARRTLTVSTETSPSIDYARQEMDLPGSQRRRTGEYQPSITSQSPNTPYNPSYPLSAPPMILPTLSTTSNYSDPRGGPPPPTSRPPPFNPIRRNLDQDWSGGR